MRWIRAGRYHWDRVRCEAAIIGFRAAVTLRLLDVYNRRRWSKLPAYRPVLTVRVRPFRYPIYLRPDSTDFNVLSQIIEGQQFAPVGDLDLRVIVDCGAYVGYSSLYFLNRLPGARVVAIEADVDNFQLCARNLAPYGDRARVVHAALWSEPCPMAVVRDYRDGGEWARRVRPVRDGERADVAGIDVPEAIRLTGSSTIDLLKIDIERSEAAVFAERACRWLTRVRNIAIELHDEECTQAFFSALRPFEFETIHAGDVIFCRRISPKEFECAAAVDGRLHG